MASGTGGGVGSPSIGVRAPRSVAGSCRAGIVATDGDMTPMGPSSGSSVSDRPADAYARLWEPGAPTPDVFAFLATRPGLTPEDRLEVLLIDQALRWTRGEPLPLRVYLAASPEIAERGDLIRALVDAERDERRRSAGRLNETVPEPRTPGSLSETTTEAVVPPVGREPDARDREAPGAKLPPTISIPTPPVGRPTTRIPGERHDADDLGFEMDERLHLRSESESLKTMLDAVRFTLVRRLGTVLEVLPLIREFAGSLCIRARRP